MDSEKERYGISLAATILCHLGAALLLGLTGFLFVKPPVSQEPIEIVLDTGGGHEGGSHKGEASSAEQPTAKQEEHPPAAEETLPDFTEAVSPEVPVETNPVTPSATPPADISTSSTTTASTSASADGEGAEGSSDGLGIGDGQGTGTGDGEGDGNGTGEGTGDGLGSGEGEGIGSNPGVPVTPPTLQNYVEPEYPGRAILDGSTGVVQVSITVNASGTVDAVSVTSSSGSSALDQAAVNAVYRWTFSPALDTRGQPTACTIHLPVTFKMQ